MAARPPATLSAMPVLGLGWAFPVRRLPLDDAAADGEAAAGIEMAADEASVRQSIELILATATGERVMRPDFGCNLDKLLFAPNNGATQAMAAYEVREALENWEPRIDMLDVRVAPDGKRQEVLLIEIGFRILSTDNRYNLVYPFYLRRPLT